MLNNILYCSAGVYPSKKNLNKIFNYLISLSKVRDKNDLIKSYLD